MIDIIIRKDIKINFNLDKYTKRCIEELEEVYEKVQKIKDKNSKEYEELNDKFYSLTLELEISVLAGWRSGYFSEKEGDLLLYKYNV
jgi:hypothetical protein